MSIENWNEDSILSRAGYKADGSQSTQARIACINRAIAGREEKALEVLRHLRWLIDDRGDRFPKAQRRWQEDREYVCRAINRGLPGNAGAVKQQVTHLLIQQQVQEYKTKDIFSGRKRLAQASDSVL